MKFREKILVEVSACRKQLIFGMFLSVLGLFIIVPGLHFKSQILHIAGIIVICFGLFWVLKSRIQLKRKVKCPFCRKNLAYLFCSFAYVNVPNLEGYNKKFPEGIDACPYCRTPLDTEISPTAEQPE